MSTVQSVKQPTWFFNPLTEYKDRITSIWTSMQSLGTFIDKFERAVTEGWTALKEASKSFPLITFVAFRALQLVIPMIALGLEVCYLYFKTTYESYNQTKVAQVNADLTNRVSALEAELADKIKNIAETQPLFEQMRTTLKESEVEKKLLQIDYALLNAKNTALTQDLSIASKQLDTLTEEHNILKNKYAAVDIPSSRVAQCQDYTKLLNQFHASLEKKPQEEGAIVIKIFSEQVLPKELEWIRLNNTILHTELDNLPPENGTARSALARSCKALDDAVFNLMVLETALSSGVK